MDGPYRYMLGRHWNANQPRVTFIMLNPSTADGSTDDPTIRRCIGFAKAWGYGRLHVVNLYAWRATNPRHLLTADDPAGPRNKVYLQHAIDQSQLVVAAWGSSIAPLVRAGIGRANVAGMARDACHPLQCLGLTAQGHPRHPLFVRADTPLQAY